MIFRMSWWFRFHKVSRLPFHINLVDGFLLPKQQRIANYSKGSLDYYDNCGEIDPWYFTCCDGIIYSNPPPWSLECCGNRSFVGTSGTQVCCDNVLRDSPKGLLFPPCCGNETYDLDSNQCCNKTTQILYQCYVPLPSTTRNPRDPKISFIISSNFPIALIFFIILYFFAKWFFNVNNFQLYLLIIASTITFHCFDLI